ncbi:MAG: oligogalacturonate lyase family protein [Opitutaceae bacterium]|jgi:oligogalacturonide lyase
MRLLLWSGLLAGSALSLSSAESAPSEVPREWVDEATGHRVRRLSNEAGTASLYFHQDAFLRDGRRMLVTTPRGIAALDIETGAVRVLIPREQASLGGSSGLEVGHRTGHVYFEREQAVWAVNPDTGETRRIAGLPERGKMSDINADETLLVGTTSAPGYPPVNTWPPKGTVMHGPDGRELTFAEMREVLINRRLEQRVPMTLFTLDLRTGEVNTIRRTTDWLGHVQCSPTDPGLIMFCHEGNWHKVERLWTIRTDGTGLARVHARTMNMEIWGHEFFSPDGGTIWYDLQTPRGEVFWLAGYELATGRRTWYHVERNAWSVHFNISPDGRRFAGDGGDAEMVAKAPDGKWIYLFEPEGIPDVAGISAPGADTLVHPGRLRARRLVNLGAHDYRVEPNVRFSPDGRWVIFRANLHGEVHTYAVDTLPTAPRS